MPSIALPVSLRGQLLSGTRTFSPASLFSANEPGVWFDPSDLTTLFQDPAGTTPVTAPGNTVGLMLDKSKGLALGAELVANGDFASSANWTAQAGWAVSGGKASASASNAAIYQALAGTVNGARYRVTFTVSDYVSGSVYIALRGGQTPNVASNGTFTALVGPTSGSDANCYVAAASNFTGSIDNISVRELAGNHATQATIAARPTYSIEPVGGRRNLLTYSQEFDNAVWVKASGAAITANTDTAPDGTLTADTLTTSGVPSFSAGLITQVVSVAATGVTFTFSAYLKASSTNKATIWLNLAGGAERVAVVVNLTSSYQRYTVSATFTSGSIVYPHVVAGDANLGTNAGSILIWGAQLELGSTATPYQRVTTQHDVTEAGVASVGYLYFDGVSNNMVTSSVNFTSTNKMTAFAGYRAIEKTGSTMMFELSSVNSNVGSFSLNQGPIAGTTGFGALMNTGSVAGAQTDPLTIPYTSVASLKLDSALVGTANEISLRMNGAVVALPNISGADSGTGNFGNYPFYIGARGGSAFPFKGHIYSLIARGALTDAPTITSTETWVAGKTGFYTPIITGVPTIGVS